MNRDERFFRAASAYMAHKGYPNLKPQSSRIFRSHVEYIYILPEGMRLRLSVLASPEGEWQFISDILD